jgi:TolB-like protein/DNA-binding winged helix-turn-helix (wHTH) protein/Tfp pilus assembly protein PilF
MSSDKLELSTQVSNNDLWIADWHVQTKCNRISRKGKTIRLEPRTMSALLCFVQNPGQVVTRQQLEDFIWPKMEIGYDALSNTIAKLRKSFEGKQKNTIIIETIPKVGYRLIAEVSLLSPDQTVSARRKYFRWEIATLITLLTLVVGGSVLTLSLRLDTNQFVIGHRGNSDQKKPTIAVLPFTNLSNNPEQEYFSDGLTDDLITDLSRMDNIFVVSRHSTFKYKNKSVTAQQISQDLGVRYIVDGSVRKSGNQVRLNVQLVDATSGNYLWAKRYDSNLTDVFAVQDQLAKRITQALSVTLAPDEQLMVVEDGTSSTTAYELFLKGQEHFRRQTREDFANALSYFEQAITIDPDYSRAYAALAALFWETRQREWDPVLGIDYETLRWRTIQYLEKVKNKPTEISLMTSARVHMKLGEYQAAIKFAEMAVSLAPNNADAHATLAEVFIFAGNSKRALQPIARALQLDPLHQAYVRYLRGLAAFGLEDFQSAVSPLEMALKLNPDYRRPALILAATYAMLGRTQEASGALSIYLSEYRGWWSNVNSTILMFFPFQHDSDRERLAEGFQRAGLSASQDAYAQQN